MPKYKNILNLSKQSFKRRCLRFKVLPAKSVQQNIQTQSETVNQSLNNLINSMDNENLVYLNETEENFADSNRAEINLNDESQIQILEDDKIPDDGNLLETQEKVVNFLKNWSFQNNITRVAVNSLLKFLKKNGFYFLPADSRTFFQTPKTREVVDMAPGKYSHIGIKRGLDYNMSQLGDLPSEIELDFNIDGVPISKSSKSSFWLILARIVNSKQVFVVGVYHGYKKPENFANFLRMLVDELKILTQTYNYKNKDINVKVRIKIFYIIYMPL